MRLCKVLLEKDVEAEINNILEDTLLRRKQS
jgi:hypothetical protein